MKTTKRSKMLLSSIAMLLVALVALGSATFAWYSINRTVRATDIKVTASKVGGLEIQSNAADASPSSTTEWTDAITFTSMTTVKLDPAAITVNAGTGAVTAQTGTHNDGGDSVGSVTLGATTAGNDYFVEKAFKVRNHDKDTMNVKPTVAFQNAGNNTFYVAALYENVSGTWTKVAEVASAASTTTTYTGNPSSNTAFEQDVEHEYKLVIYADGAHSNCTANNGNAIAEAVSTVSVVFA